MAWQTRVAYAAMVLAIVGCVLAGYAAATAQAALERAELSRRPTSELLRTPTRTQPPR